MLQIGGSLEAFPYYRLLYHHTIWLPDHQWNQGALHESNVPQPLSPEKSSM